MSDNREGMAAVMASLLVLFTAMLDPVISASVAAIILAGAGIWKLVRARRG
jgi:hypothetical protein